MTVAADAPPAPFAALAAEVVAQEGLRARITAAHRRPEPDCLPPLLEAAALAPEAAREAEAIARRLVAALRAKRRRSPVEALMQEFALSSQEGIALMCLAEALLRIPDTATRDALIRDKIAAGDWRAHLGQSDSLFVNAATWGLLITGRLVATRSEAGLAGALTRLILRGGEPLIRLGVDAAMRLIGEQFVAGRTIAEALAAARPVAARGFSHSFDMLGEAAMTAADAETYRRRYAEAIAAVGAAAAGRGPIAGPGISVKLSALHPRYTRSQRGRVMAELLPRLHALAAEAKRYDIGFNIDAEEADRLDLSLDLFEALAEAPDLAPWQGLGFVVQAYQKRAPFVIDWLIALARRTGRRLMVRLVKGAYWDSEIKRAQVEGQADFPVFTRKIHTDVCYLACARRLLAARGAVFPQFATHNAATVAAVLAMAGPDFRPGDWEFQCLHGMGEPLYEEVVGPQKLDRPCRIYAPVGTHETLLPYLVRRLLENGANSSFVNRIANPAIPAEALIADPVAEARRIVPLGAPHPRIAAPRALFPDRLNSAGLDLADEAELAALAAALAREAGRPLEAVPLVAGGIALAAPPRSIRNPADRREVVGTCSDAGAEEIEAALAAAAVAQEEWQALPPADRARRLEEAARLMEANRARLIGPLVREAGRTLPNAIAELREAVDFLRYYAAAVATGCDPAAHRPLGPVACISPWNFPLAIFTGQIAAALAAGNVVLAKPAEETPLVATLATRMLHAAGVPEAALQLLPGDGTVGAALVRDPRIRGVMFTGSTEVARLIDRTLAKRLNPDGTPVPLIAETGGQNAMVVDSSALPEQVVADVLVSAFDSAGQRCSALRLLCLQEEIADRVLAMLKGAMAELALGPPDRLATDIGPVITDEARTRILAHIEAMRARGHAVHAIPLPADCRHGSFVPPTLIEIDRVDALGAEVFGPVLHVLRFGRDDLDRLVAAINATGYALTFGVQSRIDETIARATDRIAAGNVYVNRSMIGAVVGVQPFGGHGLSGTGPKAGGPLSLIRLFAARPAEPALPRGAAPPVAAAWIAWLEAAGQGAAAARCRFYARASRLGLALELPGPVGESNLWRLEPRGTVLCVARTAFGLAAQVGAVLATGNRARIHAPGLQALLEAAPAAVRERITPVEGWNPAGCACVLAEHDPATLVALLPAIAAAEGPVRPVFLVAPEGAGAEAADDLALLLLAERTISTNTAAAGGNATLMAMA